MGKKTQNNNKAKPNSNSKSKPVKEEKELLETVDSLLRLTTLPVHQNLQQSLECQKQIGALLERIRTLEKKFIKKQKSTTNAAETSRTSKEIIENFTRWLNDHGALLNQCTITSFDEYDLGIKTNIDISQSSMVIAVPRKIMMSIEAAQNSIMKDLINKVEILKNMPNVLLAMYLLVEKFSENSLWRSYLDILPKSYNTVLYFSLSELEELKGSPTFEVALKQIKSIVRQYTYFHKLFWTSEDAVSTMMRTRFTFNEYCWAVSTVMTRQNLIPSEDGSCMLNALIPLWDLCNHSNGTISTDYNPELKRSECQAFRDFKAGEQLFIFYGPRSNADFFIHNGFVYEENENDIYWMRLGISKSDPLQDKRRELLNKLAIWSTAEFSISKGSRPIDGKLLAFVRIFNMDGDQLDHWIKSEKSADLQYPECSLDTALEKKSWTFLKARLNLLLATYKTKLEEDEKMLQNSELSGNSKLAIKMRLCEKRMLTNAIQYADEMIQK